MTTSQNYLRFDDEAQEIFETWFMDLQRKIENEDLHPALASHLAKYRSLMPSLALIFHLIEWADKGGGAVDPVSSDATLMACAWIQYLESHARRLYALALDSGMAAAAALSKKIEAGKLESPFKARSVQQKGWGRLNDAATIKEALAVLEDSGWVREISAANRSGAGRPPDPQYMINPLIHNNNHKR